MGLLNPGGPIAQFKRNRCSISPVEVILLSGVRTKDYQDNADTSTIEKLLTHAMCSFLKTYLIGVLTNQQIAVLGKFYKDMFLALVNRYHV